jgi:hypothetical protein
LGISSLLVVALIVVGCGSPGESRSVPAASGGAKVELSKARSFLEEKEAVLFAACSDSGTNTSVSDIPPTTEKGSPSQNGFLPIVGPGCTTGFVAESGAAIGSKRGVLPPGVQEVHGAPAADSKVVGYVISGRVGWVGADDVRASGVSLEDLVNESATIQAERQRNRSAVTTELGG